MVKKRAISLVMLALLIASLCCNAFAATADTVKVNANSGPVVNASSYLSTYSVSLSAASNHQMAIGVSVDGTSIMTKIGVSVIDIDQKINGVWSDYENLYAIDNPSFYQYNTLNYVATQYFAGTQGVQYRVTLTVYAGKNGGGDTRTITSYTATCN